MTEETRVAVLGASGYAGGELVRLLAAHRRAEVTFLGAKDSAGKTLAEVHPHLVSLPIAGNAMEPIEPDAIAGAADVVFSALPNGTSASLVPALLDAGLRVIDLAGDFRLPAEAYPEWYGFEHPAPALLEKAVYGVPELFGAQVAGAELVANPGCYATSAILGLAPLLGDGLIEPGAIRVDGKTGLSGAGKAANESTIYTSTEESIRPYRVPRHQHTPEIERGLELATGVAPPVLFVPHLVPAVRGVLTTSYATLTEGTTTETLTEALTVAYAGRPFVRVLAPGAMADSKRVRGTNVIELQAVADARTGTAVVVGAVDNLVKGAAGQAIQNLNLALGFDEAEGLPTAGGVPVSVTYPLGFRAAGVTAGFKPSGLPDLGLLVGDPGTTAAALFTTNAVAAAPIEVGRDRLARGRIRAVLVNSGQANAATGPRGIDDAVATSAEAASLLGAEPDEVLPSSTGVIGEPLHVDRMREAMPELVGALSTGGGDAFARAIMTTDTVHKQATADAGAFRVGGCAKGVGMIAPNLATMLAFVTTDAAVAAGDLQRARDRAARAAVQRAHGRRVHVDERHGAAARQRRCERRRRRRARLLRLGATSYGRSTRSASRSSPS